MPFAVLYLDGADSKEASRVFYLTRNHFHPGQGAGHYEDPGDEAYEREPGMWHFVTSEGAGCFAADAPKTTFYRQDFPRRRVRQYFLAWLSALNQRFVLNQLAREVMQWCQDDDLDGAGEEAACVTSNSS